MPAESDDITRLLRAHRDGSSEAFDELIPLVHDHLRRLARAQLRRIPPGATLDTVALVNEAYLRMVDETDVEWESRAHFFGITSRAMRRIVVDQARRRFADKRGGGQIAVTLDPELVGAAEQADAVLAVHEALEKIATFDERMVRIVECRFFGGMTHEEIADALGVTTRTIEREWRKARAWLLKLLQPPPTPTDE